MAVILCVFSYEKEEEKTKVLQEIHVMKLDENDKLLWVTKDKDLALQLEEDFEPLYLEKDDFAPVAHVAKTPETEGKSVQRFEVYYHGVQAKFKCGDNKTQGFKTIAQGVGSPGGHG